jgi:anti-sigma factor RsiW
MSDCPNAEVRDLLPDLVHDRLDARTRAQVVAHVDGCADCRAELALLRSMRGALEHGTPRVDVHRIVASLPSPATAGTRRPRRVWSDWRVAAAVTFLVAGGTSVALIHNARNGDRDSVSTAAVRPAITVASESTTRAATPADTGPATRIAGTKSTTSATPAERSARHPQTVTTTPAPRGAEAVASAEDPKDQSTGLGSGRIGDLNARQLKSLLNEIDHMDATPSTEPEPVSLRVGSRSMSPTGL